MGFARLFAPVLLITLSCAANDDVVRKARLSIQADGQTRLRRADGRGVVRSAMAKRIQRERSQEEQQPKHKWIYAIQTCPAKSYVRQVEAQMSTWLKPVNKSNLVVVGGPYNNGEFLCDERQKALNCKEATVLYRAAGLAEEVDADWLFHVIDDAYVFLPRVWKAMERFDPSEPKVIANFGCGQRWEHHPLSKGNTIPKLKGWIQPKHSCEQVERKGGICTGAGYIVSRGALKLLRQNYTLPAFIEHYSHMSVGKASDSTSTCLFYDRNISIGRWPEYCKMAQTRGYSTAQDIVADKRFGVVHVNFGSNKARNPLFMEQLQEVMEQPGAS